jgi:phosphoribosylamine--glycine ligase
MLEVANGKLKTEELEWDQRASITVVVASRGYPGTYQCGFEIKGLDQLTSKDALVFHAGTAREPSGAVTTSGGRVLGVSALGETLKEARDLAYQTIDKISFEGAFYRKDIGKRILERTEKR